MANMNYLEADAKLQEYSAALLELRKDGVNKIADMKQEIAAAKRNKLMDAAARDALIAESRKKITTARSVAEKNRAHIAELEKDAVARSNELAAIHIKEIVAEQNTLMATYKADYAAAVSALKADEKKRTAEINASYAGKTTAADRAHKKEAIRNSAFELRSALFDAKSKFNTNVERAKTVKNQAYADHILKNRALRNGTTTFSENMSLRWQNYLAQFRVSKFLLENGLYIAIVVFFVVCVIVSPLIGNGALLTFPNILTILEQSSTRMFYALGVAGLILIAGTDLSIGRMVAMGSVVTGLILHPGMNIVMFFNLGPWDFSALPTAVRLLMALILSIVLCVLMASFSGFFTAKFKIHPFISTLSTQLIIYGFMFFGTSGTPVGSIDPNIKDLFGGRWTIGELGGELITFPKLIIPAVIAVIVAWFIWNKTRFGKYMYAVGGNAEAASVSGINVFWVTMGIFMMAGVFYGFGSFFEAFRANASAGTGQGFELDAIAACVVGGISFSGGIGKIGGAVLGVIIFTSLTYCLTYLGIDSNLQFVFKGLIIIAAVALDSIKYLKRK
ncbi:MAG: galactoside ABC transporter permease [Treponema sp.]|nr:galactoside ABC transporter permease [Treponema sp.]